MMEKYRSAVCGAMGDERARTVVTDYFELEPCGAGQVFDLLQRWGASQADLVLVLFRTGMTDAASHILGRSVPRRCPPALRPSVRPVAPRSKEPDDRIIVKVAQNPRLPTTPAWSRYREFAVGRTLRQAVARGVTRRDVRWALRRGHVRVRDPR